MSNKEYNFYVVPDKDQSNILEKIRQVGFEPTSQEDLVVEGFNGQHFLRSLRNSEGIELIVRDGGRMNMGIEVETTHKQLVENLNELNAL